MTACGNDHVPGVWNEWRFSPAWVAPGNARATVEVRLAKPGWKVEIVVTRSGCECAAVGCHSGNTLTSFFGVLNHKIPPFGGISVILITQFALTGHRTLLANGPRQCTRAFAFRPT